MCCMYDEDGTKKMADDFKYVLIGERETPGIKCYKSYKVYKYYNCLFKLRRKEQLSNLNRRNAFLLLT